MRPAAFVVVAGLLPLVTVTCAALPATAAGPTEELRGLFVAANRVLAESEQRELEETLLAVIALARPMIATREAAEVALGSEWRARTQEEREEYVRLFSELLERALVLRLAGAARGGTGVDMRFLEETIEGDRATVQATVVGKDGNEIPIEYRLIQRGSGWAVRDVTIHGVSIIANYQAQFSRIVRDASYDELLARLRERSTNGFAAPVMTVRPATPAAVAETGTSPAPTATDVVVERVLETPVRPPVTPAPPQPLVIAARPGDPDVFERRPLPGPRSTDAMSTAVPVGRGPETSPALATPLSSPPAAKISVARASASLRYWVQVGAFKDADAASRLAHRLLASHLPVEITPGVPLTRVRVGPYPDREQAASQLRALTERGYRPFLAEQRVEHGAARP